ncbi:MAG: SGNH/GDSL hydrolase family protein, partial [Bacteroidaceae bacterium]|nr:SGNH/GDSL hydrolase family protein [Bacteroidaceae bacterium]
MKARRTMLLLALLTSLLSAEAQVVERTFYIDYGQNNVASQGYKTVGADKNGHYWNNIFGKGTAAPDKAYPQTISLVASDNTPTDCQLQLASRFSTNGYTNGGLQNPSASLLGDLAIESATQDYIFLEGGQDYGVIHFKGLDLSKAYRFYMFGSRVATDTRAAWFDLTGENCWREEMVMSGNAIGSGGYNGNNNSVLTSDLIFPDKSGNIDLTIIKRSSGIMVYLNCMKIEEVSGVTRPNQELVMTQKMYFDFGETSNSTRGHQTTGTDANGNRWNNITSGSSSSNAVAANKIVAVKNSAGTSTGARFTVVEKTYTNGVDAGGNNNPSADDLGDLAIKTATEDYVFIDNGDVRSFKLTKLNVGHCYRFFIYGSRNHTDNRATLYTIKGQHSWTGGQTTSGSDIGGEGYNGNLRNILQTDYIYPDKNGNIVITYQRVFGMAHISAMRIEEYEGGSRPEEPLEFSLLTLSGNAEDVTFKALGGNLYEAFARLEAGSFNLAGTVDGETVTLSDKGDGTFGTDGSTPFSVANDCVARITVNTAGNHITVLPVTMNVRGNIGGGNPEIPYKGDGVFEGEVTLPETTSQQWVDKTMYFALNNDDAFAIKRLQGAATRYALGEVEKGQSVENIYQNAGTYTITVNMKDMVYDIAAPIDENRISVFGSSVANGQGATDFKGYRYLYGQQLIARHNEGRSENPFYTTNVSIGGNTTVNLLNRYDDLIRDFGRYVIFGLSLGNEGIHGASNQQAVFNQWRDNMLTLIRKVRADGKIPMVMNNYTRGDYNENDYYYVKQLNLLIHEWDVPSTNVLGAIDKGNGQWADGYVSDTYHQNTAGHAEFMCAMVPSLFDAIKAGKPQPVRDQSKSMTIEAGKRIYFEPEETVHPFTITVRIKGTEGQVVSLAQAVSLQEAIVRVNEDGTVTYTAPSGSTITSSTTINDGNWHNITLTSYFAQRRTILYIDKVKAGEIGERLSKIEVVYVGDDDHSREVSELSFWRSGMTPEEITAVCNGRMLKSSLEIYAPLGGIYAMDNLAQSTNRLHYGVLKSKQYDRTSADVFFIPDEGTAGFNSGEDYDKIVDGNTATKWCLNGGEGNAVYNIFHSSLPIYVTGYQITTANDNASYSGRNPKAWTLYGSTADSNPGVDDASWELIASVSNDTKLKDVN